MVCVCVEEPDSHWNIGADAILMQFFWYPHSHRPVKADFSIMLRYKGVLPRHWKPASSEAPLTIIECNYTLQLL